MSKQNEYLLILVWEMELLLKKKALSNLAYSVSKPYSDSGALGMGDPGRVHILCRPALKCEDDDEVHSGSLN